MAVPEGVTPVYNNVVISVYGGGAGFGITGTNPQALVGSVYKIGSNVYRISVGQKVGFNKTNAFFTTLAGEAFIAVDQSDILITYVTPP